MIISLDNHGNISTHRDEGGNLNLHTPRINLSPTCTSNVTSKRVHKEKTHAHRRGSTLEKICVGEQTNTTKLYSFHHVNRVPLLITLHGVINRESNINFYLFFLRFRRSVAATHTAPEATPSPSPS